MTTAKRHLVSTLVAFAIMTVTFHARAQDTAIRGVVEFFTSQGCNACPPADEILSGLSQENDVIALGYHVDYWNYRGWKDTFSRHENTVLQTGYMKTFGKRALFTPQAVINGQVGVTGSDLVAIRSQLVATSQQSDLASGLPVRIEINRNGETVTIKATSKGEEIPDDARLFIIRIEAERKVLIESGENKGRMITYRNIVRERKMHKEALSDGAVLIVSNTELKKPDDQSHWIFIVQQISTKGLPGRILGAGKL